MKPFAFFAAAVLLTPVVAAAQPAAPAKPTAPAKPAAGTPPSGPTFRVPGPEDEVKAEGALTATITAFESGKPNLGDIDDTVVDAVKSQSGALTATLSQLGALKSLEYKGYTPNGVWRYHGEFANGQADLSIAFSNAGKITGLWCTPVKA